MFKRWMMSTMLVLCCASCSGGSGKQEAEPGALGKLAFGGDCSKGGTAQCQSGLCVAAPDGHLSCSKECSGDGDCGAGYRCNQMFPTQHGSHCVAMR